MIVSGLLVVPVTAVPVPSANPGAPYSRFQTVAEPFSCQLRSAVVPAIFVADSSVGNGQLGASTTEISSNDMSPSNVPAETAINRSCITPV